MAATASRLSIYVSAICCYLPTVTITRYPSFINASNMSFACGLFPVVHATYETHSAQE